MDFSSFIKPYMQTVYLLDNTEGNWEGGIWVPGEEIREPFQAAINVFSDDQLIFGDAGTYTQDDRRLFTYKKLVRGQKVEIDGQEYTITIERDYAAHAGGLRMYVARKDGVTSD